MHDNLNGKNIRGFLNNLDTYKKNLEKLEKTDNTSILKDIEESIQKYSKDY